MRLYAYKALTPNDEIINEILLSTNNFLDLLKEKLNKNDYEEYLIKAFEYLRKMLKIPNKIFLIVNNEENTESLILLFDKEADGKCYESFLDEEGKPYIIIEN